MNEQQPQPLETRSRRRQPELSPAARDVDDPTIHARWKEGLTRWGIAFAAYLKLGLPEAHTPDVLTNFLDTYVASYPDMDSCIREQITELNWEPAYRHFLDIEGIPERFLHWDMNALTELIRDVYDVVEEGGEVYLFAK